MVGQIPSQVVIRGLMAGNLINELGEAMNKLFLILLCFALVGCSPWFSGGGSYYYKRLNPATNATIEVAVESTREVGAVKIHFCGDGNVTVDIKGISPGPNNMAQALGIIENLVDTGATVAAPAL